MGEAVMKRFGLAASSSLGLLLMAVSLASTAVPVTTTFTGFVTSNNPFVGLPVVGTLLSGSFTVDPSVTPDDGPNCGLTPACWSGPYMDAPGLPSFQLMTARR